MSMVDNLSSLYNAATVILVGAVVMTSNPAHALTGMGKVSVNNRTLEKLYWTGEVTVDHSSISDVYVFGKLHVAYSTIGALTHTGQMTAYNVQFSSDVDLTTGTTTFTDSSIAGNLTIHNQGDGKPQIYLNNTAVAGNVVCDVNPCPIIINNY